MKRPLQIVLAVTLTAAATALVPGTAIAQPPAGPPLCTSNDVTITMQDLGVTESGEQGAYLHIAALADRKCVINGHLSDIRFLDGDYEPLDTDPVADDRHPVAAVDVHAGQNAQVDLFWTDPPTPGAVVPQFVQFRLPGAPDGSIVDWVAGPVGNAGALRYTAATPATS